jgi:hypothetical protein
LFYIALVTASFAKDSRFTRQRRRLVIAIRRIALVRIILSSRATASFRFSRALCSRITQTQTAKEIQRDSPHAQRAFLHRDASGIPLARDQLKRGDHHPSRRSARRVIPSIISSRRDEWLGPLALNWSRGAITLGRWN